MKFPTLSPDQFKTIDLKAFGLGLGVVGLIYLLIFVYIFAFSQSTVEGLEKQLSSTFAKVEVSDKPPVTASDNSKSHDGAHHEEAEAQSTAPKELPDNLVEGLLEHTPIGALPIVRTTDGLTSFRAYQQPFDFDQISKPMVIFVVKDFGLSSENSQMALEILPPQVGFVLSPYSTMPDEWIKLAREAKHEIWMNAPIENNTSTTNDSGAATILTNSSYVQKLKALQWNMSQGSGYIGVASYTDNLLLESKEQYSKLADEIYGRGLGFFELNPNANSYIESKALSKNAPYIKADMEVIQMLGDNSFEILEKKLTKKNVIVAVVPNYPKPLKNLAAWILKVGQVDYTLAPASALYDLALHNSTKQPSPKDMSAPLTQDMLQDNNQALHADDMVLPDESKAQHH